MSVSAWLGVSLSSSLDVDRGTGTSTRESTGMILRVGHTVSSDISVRLHSSLSKLGSLNCKLKS